MRKLQKRNVPDSTDSNMELNGLSYVSQMDERTPVKTRAQNHNATKRDSHSSQKQPRMKRRSICIELLLLLIAAYTVGCDSHTYHAQSRELIDSMHSLFISEKLCKDENDCRKKEYVLSESSTGVYVSIYGIIDQSIMKKIVSLCIEAHKKNPKIQYELSMYALTKREDLKSFKHKTAMLELILRKEE